VLYRVLALEMHRPNSQMGRFVATLRLLPKLRSIEWTQPFGSENLASWIKELQSLLGDGVSVSVAQRV
jgi:hypothetical protein